MKKKTLKDCLAYTLGVACLTSSLAMNTGCQVSVAGQTLPSPYYQLDDIQHFPAGPENKLANETAELKKQSARKR